MEMNKYKELIKQRVRDTFTQWSSKDRIDEREIYRFLHNLKGTAGTLGMNDLCQEAESKLLLFSEHSNRTYSHQDWYEQLQSLFSLVDMSSSAERSAEPESENAVSAPNQEVSRILIIDDDVELASYLKEVLEERGHQARIALTAQRGLTRFYEWKPDLILLDIQLPDLNGMDVLGQIVDKAQKEHSPIIVISIEDTRENRIFAYRQGAMDFIAKPFDQELLLAIIDNRLSMKKQWEQSIIVDELTGAYNRKHYSRMIKRLISDFQRSGRTFTLVLMDLDRFKLVNDTYGHLMGDEVLRRFAAIVMETKREEDIFCRYGGEEFTLLLPNTKGDQAVECVERIRSEFATQVFEPMHAERFSATFTAGLTSIHTENAHAEKLVEEADQALYYGKESGRNQTITYSEAMSSHLSEQRLTLIVVDDDPLIRDVVCGQFKQWQPDGIGKVEVVAYEDGKGFIDSDWYKPQDKYMIILDGSMPTMDGVEVLSRLRYQYPERDIVVAMLTARNNQSDIIQALQYGADDYIVKPFLMADLVTRVEHLIQKLLK
jgi:two-component system cell cycle response regulator